MSGTTFFTVMEIRSSHKSNWKTISPEHEYFRLAPYFQKEEELKATYYITAYFWSLKKYMKTDRFVNDCTYMYLPCS